MPVPSKPVGPSLNSDEFYASVGMEVIHESATFGNPNTFALGAGVGYRHPHPSWSMSLGHFCIYLNGFRYGIVTPDTAALGSILDEIQRRFLLREEHRCYFADKPANEIAHAHRIWISGEERESESFDYFGRRKPEFASAVRDGDLWWAPDGSAAFDDSSNVLHFDIDDDKCRLIGFRATEDGHFDPATLQDVILPAHEFYDTVRACEAWFADKMNTPARKRLPNVTRENRYTA